MTKGIYTRGPYSYACRYEKNMIRLASHAGRYPNDPNRLRKGDVWIDPIALAPQLKELRSKYMAPEPREYLKKL